jgi:hypothetical protein
VLAPLAVDLRLDGVPGFPERVRVEIGGRTEPLIEHRRTSVLLTARELDDQRTTNVRNLRDLLRAFLDHAVLSAAAGQEGQPHAGLLCFERGGVRRFHLDPFADAEEARGWLRDVVRAMLGRPHDYLMPCEAVFLLHLGAKASLGECVEEIRGSWSWSSLYGPIRRLESFAPPAEEEGRAMIEERFGCFLRRLHAEEPQRARRGRA